MPALLGDVIHNCLELLLRSFQDHGCSSLADPATVAAIKQLGGYTALIKQSIESELVKLSDNPRVAGRIGALGTALRAKVPDVRQRVQTTIARTQFRPSQINGGSTVAPGSRGPLRLGFHPESELRAPELRTTGRVDLLTIEEDACEITDYKTGSPDPHHADQLRFYALLWSRDVEMNPNSLPVKRLIISYPSHIEEVEPPSAVALDSLAVETSKRIEQAEEALKQRPPLAQPEAAKCRMCGVRQLCREFWSELNNGLGEAMSELDSNWFDFEGRVLAQNGPRSWLIATDSTQASLLLRTASESVPFQVGNRIRLLSLRREIDPETTHSIGTMTQASEVFTMKTLA